MTQPTILVHGGAGNWQGSGERLDQAIAACIRAAEAGQALLLNGHSALDAIEAATRILEDDPSMDAGIGSYPTTDGLIEVDAIIMDGQTLSLGSVAAVQRIQNPVSLARQVMEKTPHSILVGDGASRFADQIGFPRVDNQALLTGFAELDLSAGSLGDTVGAVAIDRDGNLAVATSTGGMKGQMPGRVGDSPIVGSGAYVSNLSCGVSATGYGESIMQLVISKWVSDQVLGGQSAQEACDAAVEVMTDHFGRERGQVGFIAIDHQGGIGIARNTHAMPIAFAVGNDPIQSGS